MARGRLISTLEGLALLITEGHAAAAATLQRAAKVLTSIPVEEVLHWGWVAISASSAVWDYEGFYGISARQVRVVRDVGALAQLPLFLSQVGIARAWMGDFDGGRIGRGGERERGRADREPLPAARPAAAPGDAGARGGGRRRDHERDRGVGRQRAGIGGDLRPLGGRGPAQRPRATTRRRRRRRGGPPPTPSIPGTPCGRCRSWWRRPRGRETAGSPRDALDRLAVMTQPSGNDPALGIEARCRALLSAGTDADDLYREAIDRLGLTRLRPELARAHLLYGEWLRREGRRVEAREQLRTGHDMLAAIGMGAFAERARRELIATGGKVRRRSIETTDHLTPQEEQIARLAGDGRTNPEIAAQLFLSARTVEWHLGKVFGKLGVGSRRELTAALGQRGQDG